MILQSEHARSFIDGLENLDKTIAIQATGWLKEFRLKNLFRFNGLGFPTVKDEEWKYTNIEPLLTQQYHSALSPQAIEADPLKTYLNCAELNLVFINGTFSANLSNLRGLPKGAIVSTLQEAWPLQRADIENILKKYNPAQGTFFTALNLAIAGNGAFIKITDNARVEKLIHIIHLTSTQEQNTFLCPQTMIIIGKSGAASILETHISFSNDRVYFANALTDIHLAENAILNYHKAQSESLKAFHIGTTRVWQERDSNFNGFSFMVGGNITRNNLDVILNGEGASARLNGLYCVNDTQLVDNHSTVDHRQANGTSNQLYKGVLNGASRAVFNGKIFVKPIAQKTNSYQLNKNLLLGKEARVDTKPQLEIGADDVKCTHGATIGQLNEDEIFYLQSRCIARSKAVKMLSEGFVGDIINTIPHESVQSKLNTLLVPTMAAF